MVSASSRSCSEAVVAGVCGENRFRPDRGLAWSIQPGSWWQKRRMTATMAGAEVPGSLCCGGAGQDRRQRFAGESVSRPQVGGFVDAPGGFGVGDAGPVGDGVRQFAAEFFGAGLAGQVIDQLMFGHREASARFFAAFQESQPFSGGSTRRSSARPRRPARRRVHRMPR